VLAEFPLIHPTGSTKDNLQRYIKKAGGDVFLARAAGPYGNSGRGFCAVLASELDGSLSKDFAIMNDGGCSSARISQPADPCPT